jgi:hypothetical protein
VEYEGVPNLLKEISDYAIMTKGLRPLNMTDIYKTHADKISDKAPKSGSAVNFRRPSSSMIGRKVKRSLFRDTKAYVREMLDFERITPIDELRCPVLRRTLKVMARMIFR